MSNKIPLASAPQTTPKLIKDIKKLNYRQKIKIRPKPLSDGSFSLYLDFWRHGKREYRFLEARIIGTRESLNRDNEILRAVMAKRDGLTKEFLESETQFKLNWKDRANFVEFFEAQCKTKAHTEKAWWNCLAHLKRFTKGNIQFRSIDEAWVESFTNYLLKRVANNTAGIYLSKVKACFSQAVKQRIIPINPASEVKVKRQDTHREFLGVEEIKILKKTPCPDEQIKNAFLFSCFTGLRLSDFLSLQWENVSDGYIHFQQQKTKGVERIKLSENALSILKAQKRIDTKSETVFNLPKELVRMRMLKKWIKQAGIKKKITWHNARHSFATLCITSGIDIFTVSKLLGHRELKTTQIYAKLIDQKKDEAIDKLPTF